MHLKDVGPQPATVVEYSGPRPGERHRGNAAMVMIAALSGVLLVIGASFSFSAPGGSTLLTALPLMVSLLFVIAGLIAWRMRPHNRIGLLMLLTGLSFWLAGLVDAPVPFLTTVGVAARALPLAMTLHLLLAFPSGRVQTRSSRILVVIGYLASTVLQAPQYLVGDGPLAVWNSGDARSLAGGVSWVQTGIGVFALLAASALITARASRSDPAERRQLGPMAWYRIVSPVVIAVAAVTIRVAGESALREAAAYVELLAILGLPVAFLVGLLFGSFGRAGAVDEMVARIGAATPSPVELTAAVAAALGDPTATVVYARGNGAGFVDGAGREVAGPSADSRVLYPVWYAGRIVGGIVYRDGLIADDSIMAVLAGIAGMAIDQQRLVAEQRALVADLRAGEVELRSSRRRLLRAEDTERRRIARDLHDGAQQHIVVLGLAARRLSRRTSDPDAASAATLIADELTALLVEFRDLIAGIMPAPLLERGLAPAVELLAARMPIPTTVTVRAPPDELAAEAESTMYFLVSEALTNVAKHSRASSAEVTIDRVGYPTGDRLAVTVADNGAGGADPSRGTGLRGLADRIATLGGTVRIDSPAGAGSSVRVEIPCG